MPGVPFSQSLGDLMVIVPFESERGAIRIYSRAGDMNQDEGQTWACGHPDPHPSSGRACPAVTLSLSAASGLTE